MENIESNVVIDNRKGFLALPFNENQFEDFIKGLLGTPQTITKKISGNFELSLSELQNFHELISQRITQQNHGNLIQVKTKIYFSDESSVTLSSIQELNTYNEIKPIISVAVRMIWTYLIKFEDKNVPEKQEIEIMIISTPDKNIIEDNDIPIFYPSIGQFQIRIAHTARSWGSDLEALITTHINSIISPPDKIKTFLRKHNLIIGVINGLIFLIVAIYTMYIHSSSSASLDIDKVKNLTQKPTSLDIKLDFLLNYIVSNGQNLKSIHIQLYTLVSGIISIIAGFWVASFAFIKERSFIILTAEAKKHMVNSKEKDKKKLLCFIGSVITSIVCSILASFFYSWLNNS